MRDCLARAGLWTCPQGIFLIALIDVARAHLKAAATLPGVWVLACVRGAKDYRELACVRVCVCSCLPAPDCGCGDSCLEPLPLGHPHGKDCELER